MEAQTVYQVDERMADEAFDDLKHEIRRVQIRLDRLQALYRGQVGREYRPAPR